MLALQGSLAELRLQAKACFASLQSEVEEQLDWLTCVHEGLKNGSISVQSILLPKTPGKRDFSLATVKASLDSTIDLEEDEQATHRYTRSSRSQKKGHQILKNEPQKKTRAGRKKAPRHSVVIEIDEHEEEKNNESAKRPSDETLKSRPKRVCLSSASRDSGLSSAESRNTGHSSMGGLIKQENVSLVEKNVENTFIELNDVSKAHSNDSSNTQLSHGNRKRTRSAGRGTFVINNEVVENSVVESVTIHNKSVISVTKSTENAIVNNKILSLQIKNEVNSPAIKKPSFMSLVKGDCVKKAVQAFEALRDEHTQEQSEVAMPPPASHLTKVLPAHSSAASSLDDAISAPPRLTRTKTRAMAKAAAEEEAESKKCQDETTHAKMMKSPLLGKAVKHVDKTLSSAQDKEATTFTSTRPLHKPFGSASKPTLYLKPSTPLNRSHLHSSHPASSSFSVPRLNNLVTGLESFISKPVVQEVRTTREDNLQKIVAKVEVASKKKEEIMKAQLEERMKKREEKRIKVCATREALEREKQEMQQRLERERDEKQKLLQAEREEKLRQEALKKKRLAQQKAAETEERRRQEETARLAKMKQQEEEQKRIAALKKKEQEEAERRYQERLQQEREVAALRAKEAERQAKEEALKAKNLPKHQLDRTYDTLPNSQSYGLTPVPEDRQPLQPKNADNYSIGDVGTDDSSEDESKPKKVVPMWAQSKQRMPKLMYECEVTHQQMSIFFGSQKCTPDLSKIFTDIDRRQLIRKSSAVWRTPPIKFSSSFCAQ